MCYRRHEVVAMITFLMSFRGRHRFHSLGCRLPIDVQGPRPKLGFALWFESEALSVLGPWVPTCCRGIRFQSFPNAAKASLANSCPQFANPTATLLGCVTAHSGRAFAVVRPQSVLRRPC